MSVDIAVSNSKGLGTNYLGFADGEGWMCQHPLPLRSTWIMVEANGWSTGRFQAMRRIDFYAELANCQNLFVATTNNMVIEGRHGYVGMNITDVKVGRWFIVDVKFAGGCL
jgi:hypothetical protein